MKRIFIILATILVSIVSFAQSKSEIDDLYQKSLVAAQDGDFAGAKENYDAVIAIIQENPDSDLALNIPAELSEYIIINQAQSNQELARQYALTLLELQMHCLAYCAKQGYFSNNEEYVDNISYATASIGYVLAEAGLYKDAEDCIKASISIFPQNQVFTQEYPLAYERLAYFFQYYCSDYENELIWQYEGFKASVALSGIDAEQTIQSWSRLSTSYALDFAALSYVGEQGDRFKNYEFRQLSYDQILRISDIWNGIREDIYSKYGSDTYTTLLAANPIDINGDDRIKFGTKEWEAFNKTLAAIHYNKILEYEQHCSDLFNTIQEDDGVIAYSIDIIQSLRNHNQVNLAISLYDKLLSRFSHKKALVEFLEGAAGAMAYSYGLYDKAWTYVSDLEVVLK